MAEGTNVGSIFLDLIVRNTVEKQIQSIASEGQRTAQKAFSGVEKAAERMASGVANQSGKLAETAVKSAAESVEKMTGQTKKSTEKLQSYVRRLEDQLSALDMEKEFQIRADTAIFEKALAELDERAKSLKAQLTELSSKAVANAPASMKKRGQLEGQLYTVQNQRNVAKEMLYQQRELAESNVTAKFKTQQERLMRRIEAARERLAIQTQIAAEKQVASESAAVQKTVTAEEKAANRRKAISAAMWKNMLSHAGSAAKSITGKITGIIKRFTVAGRATQRFGSRLREIASSALIFNGLSVALRKATQYIGQAVASSDQMKSALANLKGAAANAASPLIQVLTPALTALANAAATVFSYVARLLTLLTGKISNASAVAAKSASTTATAAKKASKSLAGFDEINQLGSNSGDSGGGSGNGSIQPNYDFEGKSEFLDAVLAAIEQQKWDLVGELLAQKINDSLAKIDWKSIQKKATAWTRNLVDVINGFTRKLDWGLLGSSIGNGLNTVLCVIDTFFQGIDWQNIGRGFGTGLNRLFRTTDWAMLGRTLTDKFKALFEMLHGFVETFDFEALGANLATMLVSGLKNINWIQLAADLVAAVGGLIDICSGFIQQIDWRKLGEDLWNGLVGVVIAIDWGKLVSQVLELLGSCVGASLALYDGICQAFADSLIKAGKRIWAYFESYINDAGGNIVLGIYDGIVDAVKNIAAWIQKNILDPFMDGFKKAFGIHSPSTVMKEQGRFLIEGLLDGITSTWSKITLFFDKALSSVTTKFSGAFTSLKKTVSDIWKNGIVPAIKSPINTIISCINGMVSGIVKGINAVVRSLNGLSIKLPEWDILGDMAGKKLSFNLKEMTAPKIPYLADGGVITQPTLAMMGEYSGARNNPEIVAPQSIIAETVASVLENAGESKMAVMERILTVLLDIDRLLQILSNKDWNLVIDGDLAALARILKPYIDRENRRVGGNLVKGGAM